MSLQNGNFMALPHSLYTHSLYSAHVNLGYLHIQIHLRPGRADSSKQFTCSPYLLQAPNLKYKTACCALEDLFLNANLTNQPLPLWMIDA